MEKSTKMDLWESPMFKAAGKKKKKKKESTKEEEKMFGME